MTKSIFAKMITGMFGLPAKHARARRSQRHAETNRMLLQQLETRVMLTFSVATNFTVGTNPISVAIADVNGDGKPDLVTANSVSNDVSVLLGTGTGSFGSANNFTVGSNPQSVAIADMDGDGKLDLVTANAGSDNVSVLLGTGTGSFGAATNFTVGSYPRSVAIADVNGDGKPDLVIANVGSDNVSVLLNTYAAVTSLPFQTATNFAAGPHSISVTVGDFNGDGKPDLAVANYGTNNVSVLLGNGAGGLRGGHELRGRGLSLFRDGGGLQRRR